jgi:NAD(P)H-hydrate epimerase
MAIMREWTGQNTNQFAVMSRQSARDFDNFAINQVGIPGIVLMENAGRGVAEVIIGLLESKSMPHAVIFCGRGNNGGDGFVIARHLWNQGWTIRTALCTDPTHLAGDALTNFQICQRIGIQNTVLDMESSDLPAIVHSLCVGQDVIVDAVFGTGLKGQLSPSYGILINALNTEPIPIIAVDIPSGLECDTGRPLPVSVHAMATVTCAGLKQGFVQNPDARNFTGRIFVASIGLEPRI